MPDGGRDFMLATEFGGRAVGSVACSALAAEGFTKLSAGLAGQGDRVTEGTQSPANVWLGFVSRLSV